MNILAIESSSDQCILALRKSGQIFTKTWGGAKTHSTLILNYIDTLLKKAGISVSMLNVIGVGCGPGSFTGVRLAISVAQGLAYANRIPVVRVNSLAIFAQTAYCQRQCDKVIVAMNARQGECYVGEFSLNSDCIMTGSGHVEVKSITELALIQPSTVLRLGNGFLKVDSLENQSVNPDLIPTGQALMQLVEAQIDDQTGIWDPMDLQADYVLTNLYQPKQK